MKELNNFQKEFMKRMAYIQDTCVQIALCQNNDKKNLEEILYDVAGNVIIEVMTEIDGYGDRSIGRLNVTCNKTGENIDKLEFHALLTYSYTNWDGCGKATGYEVKLCYKEQGTRYK